MAAAVGMREAIMLVESHIRVASRCCLTEGLEVCGGRAIRVRSRHTIRSTVCYGHMVVLILILFGRCARSSALEIAES